MDTPKVDHLIKLGYQAFREIVAASRERPFPGHGKPTQNEQERYEALYQAYIAKRECNDYDYIHATRFRETVKAFGGYLEPAKAILELGGHGRVGVFARDTFGASYQSYVQDLRDPYDLPNGAFDVVLCLEVIEHLKDSRSSEIDINDIACWNYSGVLNLMYESYRVLRPGGVLLVTTPNAISVDVIKCVLAGDHPFMFGPHVRELVPMQVKAFGELVGFELESFGTFFAWGVCDTALRHKILDMIAALGFDPSHRGDDAYYALRRPT
jgi:SAM-dependent methyltransferase